MSIIWNVYITNWGLDQIFIKINIKFISIFYTKIGFTNFQAALYLI
uniref:Uncharacterized protein n=1 Tax=Anguilla anguilla TaxID=7936 RepID=A0A0E9XH49_ANGAN